MDGACFTIILLLSMEEFGFSNQSGRTQVELVASTDQCITCLVASDSQLFYLSAIYGSNDRVDRRELWSHLFSLHGSLAQKPWSLASDFNVIAHPSKSSNYTQVQSSDVKDFTKCIQQLAIFDHAYNGSLFTWSNRQKEGFNARKLDRVLINDNRLLFFSNSTMEFLPPGAYDHCPAVIQLSQTTSSPPKPFKIFNF